MAALTSTGTRSWVDVVAVAAGMAEPLSGATASLRGANGHSDAHAVPIAPVNRRAVAAADATGAFAEVWKGCHWTIASSRSNGASETRPCRTEFCIRGNEIAW